MSPTEVLQRLIRFNTVNPPGDERVAQEWLAGVLRDAGFEVTLTGRTPERPNLVARLRGRADGPTLCLLSHMDTVLATPSEWSHDPWSGDVADGFVWGRGALDMKNQTAAEVAAALELARSGWRPRAATCSSSCVVDEETGGAEGARWLVRHPPRPGALRLPAQRGRRRGHPLRRPARLRRLRRREGRLPLPPDHRRDRGPRLDPQDRRQRAAEGRPLLQAMGERQPGFDLTDGPRALLEGLGFGPLNGDPAPALERLRERDPVLGMLVEPMLGVTLAPTMAHASDKLNVIPSRATINVDCRVPPGHGLETAERRIREVLGDEGYRVEFAEQVVGNASPVESPLMDVIRDWVADQEPDALVLPTILPGFTDSRTFRDAFPECVAYGFFPQRHQTLYDGAPLIHGADERIDVRDLDLARDFFAHAARRLLDGDA
jgi:acetylornithine deacetylase/succinyl-diaminopimelate desuccinylase-like protein